MINIQYLKIGKSSIELRSNESKNCLSSTKIAEARAKQYRCLLDMYVWAEYTLAGRLRSSTQAPQHISSS